MYFQQRLFDQFELTMKSFSAKCAVLCLMLCLSTSFARAAITADSLREKKPAIVKGIYRVPLEEREGKKVWIVDGLLIRREVYPEFLYGGNAERYPFVPRNEIWIDHAISAEEFEYTLAHELHERNLMARKGMSYADAHDSSLALELKMRGADFLQARDHEKQLPHVSPIDCDGVKQIFSLPDSITLKNIYRQYLGNRGGIDIWIVDGTLLRREIFPDFGLSGNDLAYRFIPKKEIWIDSEVSCEETEFSITSELIERKLMEEGKDYNSAYTEALKSVEQQRYNAHAIANSHKHLFVPEILERDNGTGREKSPE